MNLAILYPASVCENEGVYTTDAYQHHQFPYLLPHFDNIDVIVYLKKASVRQGHEVMQVAGMRILGLPYCSNGLELYLTKVPLWLLQLVRLVWHHRREWDVVLLYDITLPNQIAYVCCRMFGIKAVLLLGGHHADSIWRAHQYDRVHIRAVAWLYARWAKIVESYLVRRLPTLADFIPYGFPEGMQQEANNKFLLYVGAVIGDREIESSRVPRNNGTIRLLSVGRVVPIKGYEYLIDAVHQLRKRGIDVCLKIIGPLYGEHHAGYEYKLRAMIREMNLEQAVRLVGPVPFREELMAAYCASDVFVISSLSEGIPKVLCEAMAKGLPIVATRVGAIPWLLKETGAGLLVKPKYSRGLADAIWEAYRRREQLSRNALRAAKQFTAEVQMKRVAEFIRQVACL